MIAFTDWQRIINEHLLAATPKTSPYRQNGRTGRVTQTMVQGLSTAENLGRLILKVVVVKADIQFPRTQP